MSVTNLISNTTPLAANASWTSAIQQTTRATYITGSVFADEAGTCYIDQSGDGINFDITTAYAIPIDDGVTIETDVINQFFRVRYVNGATPQTSFRLFVNLRDPYGDFLVAAQAPSAGGSWAVLYLGGSGYQFLGRFDGADGLNANANAAIFQNKSGQYASVPVANFVVSQETLIPTTEHAIGSF